ncbi:MAG: hypothetical protein RID53_03855 [Coleofasciculus sp. B1-GNL1-01]|uniref:hypothetical protein n=1 Tax=Coleofasciculus sp. B1-GNL1-01 TaxID=3068484 RepID=UPI0032F583DA
MNQLPMTKEQSIRQNQDATRVTHDPTLNKDAVNEVMESYEADTDSEATEELDPSTEQELGEVEQALEDLTIGIEDRS